MDFKWTGRQTDNIVDLTDTGGMVVGHSPLWSVEIESLCFFFSFTLRKKFICKFEFFVVRTHKRIYKCVCNGKIYYIY